MRSKGRQRRGEFDATINDKPAAIPRGKSSMCPKKKYMSSKERRRKNEKKNENWNEYTCWPLPHYIPNNKCVVDDASSSSPNSEIRSKI